MQNDQTPSPGRIGYIERFDESHIYGFCWQPGLAAPLAVTLSYRGKTEKTLANQYRIDLKNAGMGDGCHGFRFPLPCPPSDLDITQLRICFEDGTLLKPSRELLVDLSTSTNVRRDLLASPTTPTVALEFTTRCNLRCVYCPVSQPWYENHDMPLEDFDAFVRMLEKRRVRRVVVNGHGETTLVPGWHQRILALARAGFSLIITSNFARLLEPEELGAMAHIDQIEISVDTHKPDLLRKIRRRVDLGNILMNMAGVRAKAAELSLPMPSMTWSCVVSDKIAPFFTDYIRFGLASGIQDYRLYNLVKYDDVEGADNVRHISSLSKTDLQEFSAQLEEAKALVRKAGGSIKIHSGLVDAVEREMRA